MKRCLIIALIISLFIQLCGCTKQLQSHETIPQVGTQESTCDTTGPNYTSDHTQKPMYSISLLPIETQETAEDGTAIFHCKYQNISLILPEQEVADAVILDFLKRTDQIIDHSEMAIQTAEQAYVSSEQWEPHLLQLLYATVRLDPAVLSLRGEKRSFTGGAHAAYSGESVTYDLLTGKVLSLADILKEGVSGNNLLQLVCTMLETPATSYKPTLFTSYKDTLEQLFRSNLSSYEDWYLSNTGLNFYFDPYEIGPFSEGIIAVEIPYHMLTDILKEEYFPAENDFSLGDISAVNFEDAPLDAFTQFSEVILDKDTDKILLFTDGAISDVTLSVISKEQASSTENREQVIFSAYTLTVGDAIMVEADLTKNTLLLGYRTATEYKISSIYLENGEIKFSQNKA